MRLLIFGKNGQVAGELQKIYQTGPAVRVVGSQEVNFQSLDAVRSVIREFQPTHIINAAAYTMVDKAETEEVTANLINGSAVGVIGEEAKKCSAFVLHYSTDYVFDGEKKTPYVETDPPNPINAYGRSKLLGEQLLAQSGCSYIILRVSWVYGATGSNFLKTILRLAQEKEELRIVDDQLGAPTWSREVARATSQLLASPGLRVNPGVYNLTPEGQTTWYMFANSIIENYKQGTSESSFKLKRLCPIPSADYATPAKRPKNSRLDGSKIKETFGIVLPHWEESLKEVLSELNVNDVIRRI